MSPVCKPVIVCENQAMLFLPVKCFSLAKGFENGSGGQVWWLEEGRVFQSCTLEFALQCIRVHLLPVPSSGYTNLHSSPQPYHVSANESINQTQKVFLWLLWAKARTNPQKPSCALYTSQLTRSFQAFWVPASSVFHKA